MTNAAIAEYLLQQYAEYTAKSISAYTENDFDYYFYCDGHADLAFAMLQEKLDMVIYKTNNEYIARNAKISVTVKKEEVIR